mmetsp:Transcript_45008/g.127058  ORF Transcript_45008/g.127058 Transcript_45008/m.127058 type:complete len:238 (-) Transcript_45008:497-1210(-)
MGMSTLPPKRMSTAAPRPQTSTTTTRTTETTSTHKGQTRLINSSSTRKLKVKLRASRASTTPTTIRRARAKPAMWLTRSTKGSSTAPLTRVPCRPRTRRWRRLLARPLGRARCTRERRRRSSSTTHMQRSSRPARSPNLPFSSMATSTPRPRPLPLVRPNEPTQAHHQRPPRQTSTWPPLAPPPPCPSTRPSPTHICRHPRESAGAARCLTPCWWSCVMVITSSTSGMPWRRPCSSC